MLAQGLFEVRRLGQQPFENTQLVAPIAKRDDILAGNCSARQSRQQFLMVSGEPLYLGGAEEKLL
ncbi:hypothetical protein WI604_31470 [Bradyrhizobium symbiodeficiens]|uniref:hypothetical protein n=1 Tax=Bradyrhizobium symbiodeficiens TaxID=1404367 RepID=UPI0030D1CA13